MFRLPSSHAFRTSAKNVVAVGFVLASSVGRVAQSASAAGEFGAVRFPATPVLSISHQPETCAPALEAIKQGFFSDSAVLDMGAEIQTTLTPMPWQPLTADDAEDEDVSRSLQKLVVDLDGTGEKQVLVKRDDRFSSYGDWHYAFVFKNPAAFAQAIPEIKRDWIHTPESSQYEDRSAAALGAIEYFPEATSDDGKPFDTGNLYFEDHTLLQGKHGYYFAYGGTNLTEQMVQSTYLFQLHRGGQVAVVCSIDVRQEGQAYADFLTQPAISSLVKIMRSVGAGGNGGGSAHYGLIHDQRSQTAELRAATRPWAAPPEPGSPYYRWNSRMIAFLEQWSRGDIWSRREYQTLLEHIDAAKRSTQSYLTKKFGVAVSIAQDRASKTIDTMDGGHFLIPHGFIEHDDPQTVAIYFGTPSLHGAAILRDRTAFDEMLADPDFKEGEVWQPIDRNQAIALATNASVEWQYGLRQLLIAGADPNSPNSYGKTALMTAAHMDRSDSVELLLAAHADVNAATAKVDAGQDPAPADGRTALMYAAENANPLVMKMLLDAGANAKATDSEGRDASHFLKQNPRLNSALQDLSITEVAARAHEFTGPSFRCNGSSVGLEATICGSALLSMFDLELSYQFQKFHQAFGPPAILEQREWLARRNSSCKLQNDDQVDCLAELMRTRIRYLQNRNAEDACPLITEQSWKPAKCPTAKAP